MTRLMIVLVTAIMFNLPVQADDEELCLDCHVPAEDWEGMSAEEIFESASDMSNKRHADNAEFSEEQLKAIIATLLAE